MTTTPTAIPYEDAVRTARVELARIMDHLEDNRHLEEEHPDRFHNMWDVAHGMWTQMIWTLAQVYGIEHEEVEGDLDCCL